MNTKMKLRTMALATLLLAACSKKSDDAATVDAGLNSSESAVEAGITVVSGMADEQSGASLALRSEKRASPWAMLLPEAVAANCTRAVSSTCSSGVRGVVYGDCAVPGTLRTLSGRVDLTYSQANCSLAVTNDTVTREYNVEISGPRGGVYTLSSANATDYNGQTYGGGGELTKTAGGWEIDILGRHARFDRNGNNWMNVSVRTLTPLQVTGGLGRASRTVNGGQLQVNHNIAKFTAVFTPSNLQWTASCCHPTSGQLGVTYSGSKTGSATVTFNGCGSAELSEGGQTSTISLSYCE